MNMNRMITIIIVEDEPIIRNYIIKKIEDTATDFKVVASSFNGKEALELIKRYQPDVVFTDIRMPIMDGIELIHQLRDKNPTLPVVVLSGYDDFQYAREALRYGVTDYLLKPLVTEQLTNTLSKIRSVVQVDKQAQERKIISSELLGQGNIRQMADVFKQSFFSMFLISIGNLCNHISSVTQASSFAVVWDKLDWQSLVTDVHTDLLNWWLIDEKLTNQKFLLLSSSQERFTHSAYLDELGKTLLSVLQPHVTPYPLTICIGSASASKHDLWESAQMMRQRLEQGVVIGQSAVLSLNTQLTIPETLISTANLKKFVLLAESTNKVELRKLFDEWTLQWSHSHIPQRQVEKACILLMKKVRESRIDASALPAEEEVAVLERISITPDFESVHRSVWGWIEDLLDSETKTDQTSDLADQIESYMKANFTENFSLEELANKFNFTSAYLTKVFKKFKGENPLKYLTRLRIEEAQRLIVEHPKLDLKVIAEITGYLNQHYFSKVFKNSTGMTPSEYRLRHAPDTTNQ